MPEERKGPSEAQKKAYKRYAEKHADIRIRMSFEEKERIQKYAETAGVSLNQLVRDALAQYMNKTL